MGRVSSRLMWYVVGGLLWNIGVDRGMKCSVEWSVVVRCVMCVNTFDSSVAIS